MSTENDGAAIGQRPHRDPVPVAARVPGCEWIDGDFATRMESLCGAPAVADVVAACDAETHTKVCPTCARHLAVIDGCLDPEGHVWRIRAVLPAGETP